MLWRSLLAGVLDIVLLRAQGLSFPLGVHDEQRREDARILSEITFIKSAIQTLRKRQGRDYQNLDDMHKKMVAKMADNVEEARTNLKKHVMSCTYIVSLH